MRKVGKVLAMLAAAAITAGALAGCGSGAADKGSSAAVNGSSAAGTENAAATQGGHVLNLAKLAALQACDPHKVNDPMSNELLTAVFDGLYTLDENGALDPLMAESYEVSEDGLTYTFHLREAYWSNGEPVTANDFAFSWKHLVDSATAAKNSNEAVAAGIKNAKAIVDGDMDPEQLGVTVVDDKTLQVELEAIVPYFLKTLVRPAFLPINQAYYESAGEDYGMKPESTIYNGPYTWTYWDYATNIRATKNPDYWNADNIDIDQLNWQIVTDSQTGALMFENKELDFVEISGALINNYADNPAFTKALEVHMWYVYPNFENEVLANVNIRRALATSINKDAIAKTVLNNGSQAANYLVGYNLCFAPDEKTQMRDTNGDGFLAYDMESAKQDWQKGLEELGKDSVTLRLMYYNNNDASIAQAEYIASQWQQTLPGLKIELYSYPSSSALTYAQSGDFDLFLFRWGPDYKDPMAFLELLGRKNEHNYGRYDGEAFNDIIDAASTAEMLKNPQARWDSLAEAEKILLEEDVAVFPTVQNGLAMLINPKVHGLEVRNTSLTWNYRFVTMDD